MAVPAEKTRITVAAYLAAEEKAVDRHEYHDGEVLAMSGGTYRHGEISANLISELHQRLRGKPCRVVGSDVRVAIKPTRRYVYPDATIVCGGPQFDPDDPKQTTITNPKVVFEVLSDSTEGYDRGEKFNHYRALASLQEYVLVSQVRPMIEVFFRQNDGTWLFDARQGPDAAARLRSLELDLPLAEVYAGVDFTAPPAPEAGAENEAAADPASA